MLGAAGYGGRAPANPDQRHPVSDNSTPANSEDPANARLRLAARWRRVFPSRDRSLAQGLTRRICLMTPIVVNGSFLTQSVTGVQRYAHEMVNALGEHTEVELLVPGGAREVGPIPSRVHQVRTVGRRTAHLWEQIDLRLHLRSRGYPLLVNLGNTAPMRYRNQVVTHHDISYARFPGTYSRRFRAAYVFFGKQTLPYAREVITVSEFSKREIADFYAIPTDRIHVIPDAPIKFDVSKSSNQDGRYFLAVGSLLLHKNYETLLAAYQRFKKETRSETGLLIVGGPSVVGPNPLAPHVRIPGLTFLGRVSDDELGNLYANARAFVFPSKYEGFGMPPLEAQSVGCPVIAADTEVAHETLEKSALYFNPYSSIELARVLSSIDSDMELRTIISRLGQENAQRYSWERSAEALRVLLENI